MTEQLAQLKPEKMNAADWLKAVHDIDPFHRPVGFVSKLCKNLKIFSNGTIRTTCQPARKTSGRC